MFAVKLSAVSDIKIDYILARPCIGIDGQVILGVCGLANPEFGEGLRGFAGLFQLKRLFYVQMPDDILRGLAPTVCGLDYER